MTIKCKVCTETGRYCVSLLVICHTEIEAELTFIVVSTQYFTFSFQDIECVTQAFTSIVFTIIIEQQRTLIILDEWHSSRDDSCI